MNASTHLLDLAARVVKHAQKLGAQEVSVSVSESSHATLTRRDGKVEEASQASSRRLGLSLLVDERFSSHGTSDLRPEALEQFLARAVDATRVLEPDPDRRLADIALCGRGASETALDHLDPSWSTYTAEQRASSAEALEAAFDEARTDDVISASFYTGDGHGRTVEVTSHGFSDMTEGAWFSKGGTVTLSEPNGRRPEGSCYMAARHLSDLPDADVMAQDAMARARETIGAGPIESGAYPMILLNRSVGRILGTLGGPLSGGALHQGRSCLADRLDSAIGSSLLTLRDDPTIPRGLGSTPWDGDHMVAKPRTIIENGVLRSYYIGMYHARKLGMDPTTGGRTNWVIEPGETSWQELAKAFPKAILVTGFLGGNANAATGDFSFGIRGQLIEHGTATRPLAEMNVSGSTLDIFHRLVGVGDDPWTWSSTRVPTLIFDDVQFSGT